MKKLLFFFAISTLVFGFLGTGCEPEDDTPVVDLAPSADFIDTDPTGVLIGNYPTTDFAVEDTDALVYVAIQAVAGTADIQSITVSEDGSPVDASTRLTFRDLVANSVITANNPLLITGDNVEGFTIEIGIDPHDDIATKTYGFDITDSNGKTATLTISITTIDPGTPVEMTLEGVLFNQGGPAGFGGLDLDDGSSTGTGAMDTGAEIRDWGIDTDLPVAENWLRQIGPINGTTLRILNPDKLPEGFTFAGVETKEEISDLFDVAGEDLPNDSGEKSDAVEVGQFFAVNKGDTTYYLLEIKEVNITAGDNTDNYVIDIKY
jgi:hypothetical protein